MHMKCEKCEKIIPNDSMFCTYCGAKTGLSKQESLSRRGAKGGIKCVKCGSNDLQVVSDVRGEGISGTNMLCGGILGSIVCCGLGTVLGTMCGMAGAGETHTRHLWVCKNCGAKFKL